MRCPVRGGRLHSGARVADEQHAGFAVALCQRRVQVDRLSAMRVNEETVVENVVKVIDHDLFQRAFLLCGLDQVTRKAMERRHRTALVNQQQQVGMVAHAAVIDRRQIKALASRARHRSRQRQAHRPGRRPQGGAGSAMDSAHVAAGKRPVGLKSIIA